MAYPRKIDLGMIYSANAADRSMYWNGLSNKNKALILESHSLLIKIEF